LAPCVEANPDRGILRSARRCNCEHRANAAQVHGWWRVSYDDGPRNRSQPLAERPLVRSPTVAFQSNGSRLSSGLRAALKHYWRDPREATLHQCVNVGRFRFAGCELCSRLADTWFVFAAADGPAAGAEGPHLFWEQKKGTSLCVYHNQPPTHHKERNGESRKSQESQTKSQHRKKIANGGRGWVGETNQREESDRTMTDRMQVREPPVPVPMRDRE
jgi:hypothetical protein